MSAWIFSPDDKNFWEFMTPNFPKPMFLAHFHPGLVAAFMFGFYKNGTWPCDRPNLDPCPAMEGGRQDECPAPGLLIYI